MKSNLDKPIRDISRVLTDIPARYTFLYLLYVNICECHGNMGQSQYNVLCCKYNPAEISRHNLHYTQPTFNKPSPSITDRDQE